ncbi:hypothetical protein D6825_03770 [Candidatus Woesearchaeota archaeon]|nr:MAG: hypothetical protein D6825_03770 [Candidatus Woesearchaeota archaeon]
MAFIDDVLDECISLVDRYANARILPKKRGGAWDLLSYLEDLDLAFPPGIYAPCNLKKGRYVCIDGLLIAGENVCLRDYAYIRGPVILGDRVQLSAEVKGSIILSDSFAVHRSIYIGDSIIGRRCNIGAGSQFANLRFDEEQVKVCVEGVYCDSGRQKLGAIVEHDCKFGVNSSIKPGAYVARGTRWVGSKPLYECSSEKIIS